MNTYRFAFCWQVGIFLAVCGAAGAALLVHKPDCAKAFLLIYFVCGYFAWRESQELKRKKP